MYGPLKKEVLLNELNDLIHNCFLNGLGQKEEKGDQAIVLTLGLREGFLREGFLSSGVAWASLNVDGKIPVEKEESIM